MNFWKNNSRKIFGPANWRISRIFSPACLLLLLVTGLQGGDEFPKGEPFPKIFPPPAGEQAAPGTGKFIIFGRGESGRHREHMVEVWECIPSEPKRPITKRIEFGLSFWDAHPILSTPQTMDSWGKHPRFVEVPAGTGRVRLYDIDYRTWKIRALWEGDYVGTFGALRDSIYWRASRGSNAWMLLDAKSGAIHKEPPFQPIGADGHFWLVRKPGETSGCWSFDRRKETYVARFGPVDRMVDFWESKLSPDGKNRAIVLATAPDDWRGGPLDATLILQRDGKSDDLAIPVELHAGAGSGARVLAQVELAFSEDYKLQCRVRKSEGSANDGICEIDIKEGRVTSRTVPRAPQLEIENLWGVPVPDYLRSAIREYEFSGPQGLAPAFLKYLGIVGDQDTGYGSRSGVSPDGRHILFRGSRGPLADCFIYGNLVTKETVWWKVPAENMSSIQTIVWVETPP